MGAAFPSSSQSRNRRAIELAAIDAGELELADASEDLKEDAHFILELLRMRVNRDTSATRRGRRPRPVASLLEPLDHAAPKLKRSRDFVLQAVSIRWECLGKAPAHLQCDVEIAELALRGVARSPRLESCGPGIFWQHVSPDTRRELAREPYFLLKLLEVPHCDGQSLLRELQYHGNLVPAIQNDRKVVMAAFRSSPSRLHLGLAGEQLLSDPSIVSELVNMALLQPSAVVEGGDGGGRGQRPQNVLRELATLGLLGERVRNDRNIVKLTFEAYHDDPCLDLCGEQLIADHDFVLELVRISAERGATGGAGRINVVRKLADMGGLAGSVMPDQIKNSAEIMLSTFTEHPEDPWLDLCGAELLADRGFVMQMLHAASELGRNALREMEDFDGLAPAIKNDRELLMEAARLNPNDACLDLAGGELLADRAFMMWAVLRDGRALRFSEDPSIRSDRELVMCAVKSHWEALRYCSEELRARPDIFVEGLQQSPLPALQLAPPAILSSREVMTAAVALDWRCLERAAEDLRGDCKVLLAAVRNSDRDSWRCLQFASEEGRNNEVVVREAVAKDPSALFYASDEIRSQIKVTFS